MGLIFYYHVVIDDWCIKKKKKKRRKEWIIEFGTIGLERKAGKKSSWKTACSFSMKLTPPRKK